jgi:hypothetical protein
MQSSDGVVRIQESAAAVPTTHSLGISKKKKQLIFCSPCDDCTLQLEPVCGGFSDYALNLCLCLEFFCEIIRLATAVVVHVATLTLVKKRMESD